MGKTKFGTKIVFVFVILLGAGTGTEPACGNDRIRC